MGWVGMRDPSLALQALMARACVGIGDTPWECARGGFVSPEGGTEDDDLGTLARTAGILPAPGITNDCRLEACGTERKAVGLHTGDAGGNPSDGPAP